MMLSNKKPGGLYEAKRVVIVFALHFEAIARPAEPALRRRVRFKAYRMIKYLSIALSFSRSAFIASAAHFYARYEQRPFNS